MVGYLRLKHDVALLGQNLDAGLAVGSALVLDEGCTQLVHASRASEALRMPELVESFNVSVSKRKRVVTTTAGGLGNTFVVDRATVGIHEVSAGDGLVAFSTA